MRTGKILFRLVTLVVVSLLFCPSLSFAEENAASGHREKGLYPDLLLPYPMRGDEAIRALDYKLPDVAAWHRKDPQEMRAIMQRDKTLWVDRQGRLHYRDELIVPQENASQQNSETAATLGAPYPLDQTFLLHSKSGAKKIIYLDFNGHVIPANTAWTNNYNSGHEIVAPPWDTDGNPDVFGDAERTAIQNIWQRVAEDYAMFDVDVTTEEPSEDRITRSGTTDEYYGMRVLISPISSYFGNYGGIAYVGVFDSVGDYYKPALVFPEMLANGEKYIAEATSHETGHTLGLYHDGTTTGTEYYAGSGSGDTGWAPIMGNGYYQNLTQWSKGEYTNANNKEDDIATILTNGFGYTADDIGITFLTATPLIVNGNNVSGKGLIEQNTDVDVFKFTTAAGNITIEVKPLERGPNLDILAELRDADGNLILSGNPTSYLYAPISASVSGGTYYLFIQGTGKEDLLSGYSNYASLGQYTISGSVINPGSQPPQAVVSANPTSGTAPLNVQFSSTGSSDPDASITSYSWNFGDGATSSDANPQHTYTSIGNFTAALTVTDSQNLTDTASVIIAVAAQNKPPVAVISASPTSGTAPLTVNFDASGSSDPDGTITSYSWTFGDGGSGSGTNVSHTYNNPGTYTATLSVKDDKGASGTNTATINVQPYPNIIAAPGNLTASVSKTTVTLSWKDNSSNEEGFYIERAKVTKGALNYQTVGNVGANATGFSETIAAGTYYYRVQAYNSGTGKVSSYSNSVRAKTAKR